MSDFNPYAAPRSEIVAADLDFMDEAGLWRDGKILIVRKGSEFPDRCLACNQPAEGYRLKRRLFWHSWVWFCFLISPLIYLIVALCVRKTARVAVPLCPNHRGRRRRAILVGWLGSLAGIGICVFGVGDKSNYVPGIGVVVILVFLFYGVLGTQYAVPKRIDKSFVWLRKVSPEFLAALPDWN